MRRLSAKLERWETAGDREASLRGVPRGVFEEVDMAEDEAVVGKGDGRVRALSPDDDVGLEAAEVGCAIGDTEGATV